MDGDGLHRLCITQEFHTISDPVRDSHEWLITSPTNVSDYLWIEWHKSLLQLYTEPVKPRVFHL